MIRRPEHPWALAFLFILLALPGACSSCRQGVDDVRKAVAPEDPHGDGWKARRVCKSAETIPIIDSHINMEPEAAVKTLALNRKWRVSSSINVMGGFPGYGLEDSEALLAETKGKIQFMCNIDWTIFGEDYFTDKVLKDLQACKDKGGVGIKIFKSLGLGVIHPDGTLLRVDDPVLDPIFEKAGELGLPVLIHTGDPKAFFKPFSKDNERYEELKAHPMWRFDPSEYPPWEDVYKQFVSLVARHPKTLFIGSHFGNDPEDPPAVFAMMDANPNFYVVTSARIPEIGRFDAKKMHDAFVKYADRIIYGTDLGIGEEVLILGSSPPTHPTDDDEKLFFNASYRYFETWDRQFEHPTPIQGPWKIDGIGLPCDVLHKLYHGNAEKLFGIKP